MILVNNDMTVPDISVLLVTYNHEKYLADAIKSVVMQKGSYSAEIVVADDASTDRTVEILQQYKDIVRYQRRASNIGIGPNVRRGIAECRGEYIAFLEGDDYWVDPLKLQLQIDYMREHPDHALVHHRVRIYDQASSRYTTVVPPEQYRNNYPNGRVLALGNFIRTCSLFCRAPSLRGLPEEIFEMTAVDWPLCVMITQNEGIGFIDREMSVYRSHGGGVWTSASYIQKIIEARRMSSLLYKLCVPEQRVLWLAAYRRALNKQLRQRCYRYSHDARKGAVVVLICEILRVNYHDPVWLLRVFLSIIKRNDVYNIC